MPGVLDSLFVKLNTENVFDLFEVVEKNEKRWEEVKSKANLVERARWFEREKELLISCLALWEGVIEIFLKVRTEWYPEAFFWKVWKQTFQKLFLDFQRNAKLINQWD